MITVTLCIYWFEAQLRDWHLWKQHPHQWMRNVVIFTSVDVKRRTMEVISTSIDAKRGDIDISWREAWIYGGDLYINWCETWWYLPSVDVKRGSMDVISTSIDVKCGGIKYIYVKATSASIDVKRGDIYHQLTWNAYLWRWFLQPLLWFKRGDIKLTYLWSWSLHLLGVNRRSPSVISTLLDVKWVDVN